MTEHRWSKFWWQDYAADDALRVVSLGAQGLWMRMLCAMHNGTPYGHLTINGKAPTPRQIAAIASAPEREVLKYLAELEAGAVFSRTDDGTIYNRRMVRDKAISEKGREDGKRGGNPTLIATPNREGLTPTDNGGGYTLEAEAEEEAERKTLKPSLIPETREAEAAPTKSAQWPPDPHPSAVTATVGQVVAKLEGRARGQPFMTPRGPVRTVEEQQAALTPRKPPKVLPPEVLARLRASKGA